MPTMPVTRLTRLVLLAALLVPACTKHEDPPPPPRPQPVMVAADAAAAPARPVPDEQADHIVVLAHHRQRKPTDPVRLSFEKFRVVKADFDPQKLEGGTASLAIDLASFHTDSDERDEDLRSPAYLDVGAFATATVDIGNVKHAADAHYTADAKVTAHGVTQTYPVAFDVLATTADSVRIRGEHAFTRLDFGIGRDPQAAPDEQVATDVVIQVQLTIPKR